MVIFYAIFVIIFAVLQKNIKKIIFFCCNRFHIIVKLKKICYNIFVIWYNRQI